LECVVQLKKVSVAGLLPEIGFKQFSR
jgi:hypothetical protein